MNEHATPRATVTVPAFAREAGLSLGMGVLLMFMGSLSFPLPWTPVPFSMMPFALLVTGAAQKARWSLVSVATYLIAGGLGAPVFADGESGWAWFAGATAGYLFGFLLVAPFISTYLKRPRPALQGRWRAAVLGLVGASAAAGIAAIIWLSVRGTGFTDVDADITGFGTGRSILWICAFLIGAATLTTLLLRGRLEGRRAQSVQLFLVMLAAIGLLHGVGVTVLWLATPLSLMAAVVLGSIVFLPFDILKAALAVAVSLPFLPEPLHE